MTAIILALLGAALATAGYFGRRFVERAAEAERLRQLSLALDVARKLPHAGPAALALVLFLIRRR